LALAGPDVVVAALLCVVAGAAVVLLLLLLDELPQAVTPTAPTASISNQAIDRLRMGSPFRRVLSRNLS
jgi:hypothetical protein